MSSPNEHLVLQLGALAQATRLAVFRSLMHAYPGGIAAGKIAEELSVAPNTLSAHLAVLQRAGLIEQVRKGRSLIYYAHLDAAGDLITAMVTDCCADHPNVRKQLNGRGDSGDRPTP